MKKYYEYPTQVMFLEKYQVEEYGENYDIGSGIAYGDIVICGCCGSTVPLDEIIWIKELEWIGLTEAIRGDLDETAVYPITEEDETNYKVIAEKYLVECESKGE